MVLDRRAHYLCKPDALAHTVPRRCPLGRQRHVQGERAPSLRSRAAGLRHAGAGKQARRRPPSAVLPAATLVVLSGSSPTGYTLTRSSTAPWVRRENHDPVPFDQDASRLPVILHDQHPQGAARAQPYAGQGSCQSEIDESQELRVPFPRRVRRERLRWCGNRAATDLFRMGASRKERSRSDLQTTVPRARSANAPSGTPEMWARWPARGHDGLRSGSSSGAS
jgi:hypothetical protein